MAYQKQILKLGENNPSAILYYNGRVFVGTRTTSAKLLNVNANNLADYTSITFPDVKYQEGGDYTGQNKYVSILKLLQIGGKIYILFSGSSQLVIVEVDPVTMTWKDVVTTRNVNDVLSFWSDVNGRFIYVSGYALGYAPSPDLTTGVISQFSVGDWKLVNTIIIPNISSQYAPVTGDSTYLYYVNDAFNAGGVFMVWRSPIGSPTDVKIVNSSLKGVFLGSDMEHFNNYVYLSTFHYPNTNVDLNGKLYRFNKNTLLVDIYNTGLQNNVRGFFSDNNNLYVSSLATATSPGRISRINTSGNIDHFILPSTDVPELITGDKADNLYMVSKTVPGVIYRYSISSMFTPTPTTSSTTTPAPIPVGTWLQELVQGGTITISQSDYYTLIMSNSKKKWKVVAGETL